MVKKGIYIRFESGIKPEVRLACIEFGRWLRQKFEFPILLRVYIKNRCIITTRNKKHASATFWAPFKKDEEPYIKVSTGDYDELKSKGDTYNALMTILCSFAHEIVHYRQWCENRRMTEKEANKEAVKLVESFSNEKDGLITANKKVISLIVRANTFYCQRKYDKALEYYKKSININPRIDLAYVGMGNVLEMLLHFQEAIECYDKAIELDPKNENSYIRKGYCLDMLEKYNEAIVCYDKAIKINSKNEIAYHNKGYSLKRLNKFNEAVKCFNMSVKLNPQNIESYVFMGYVNEDENNYVEAIKCFNEVIKIDPKYELAYNDIGYALFMLGKYEEALQNYDKAIEIDPKYAEPYYKKAILYLALNKLEDSLSCLSKAIELDAEYKKYAREEKYFNNVKDVKRFISLITVEKFPMER